MSEAALARFGTEYAMHRAAEGRDYRDDELFSLPYLRSGPHARQWAVRARSFEAFMCHALWPHAAQLGRPLDLIDLGAGNAWLSYRAAREGHHAIAVDIRDDAVDGLGAADGFVRRVLGRIELVVANFEEVPLATATIDLAVFNASLHYAVDPAAALREAARVVRPGGVIVIMDTPFYARDEDGRAMVAEKHASASECFGARAESLLALPFIEYQTPDRLAAASAGLGLDWRRQKVRYPLWYELRPLAARLHGRRRPSRFDLWLAKRP
jgi:SAM-dependent methyltransferase